MSDFNMAVQVAFLQALSVPAVTDLSPVFQHVPEQTQPPVVIIADVTAEPAGGKDGGLDRMTVEIITMVRQPSRAALYALMAAVRGEIEDAALPPQAGVELSRPVFDASDDEILDDGETYMGTQRFTLFAQAGPGPELWPQPAFASPTGLT
jgi:hypothetical protein